MLCTLMVILSYAGVPAVDIQPGLRLADIPEHHEAQMQYPAGLSIDAQGRFLVVDLRARVVFYWNPDGSFQGHFGRAGEGPGEFTFIGGYGSQGFVHAVKDRIFVYDGARRVLNEFDLTFQHLGSRKFTGHGGRTNYFSMTRDGSILLWQRNSDKETPTQEMALYGKDLKQKALLHSFKDRTYIKHYASGTLDRVTFNAMAPGITAYCDPGNNEILVGETGEPRFHVYNSDGKKVRTIRFEAGPPEVTDEDKKEYSSLGFLRNKIYRISFPENKPYYQVILPIEDKRFLVYNISPISRRISGFSLSEKGKILGILNFTCGENGSWLGSRNKVVSISTDEDGSFELVGLNFR